MMVCLAVCVFRCVCVCGSVCPSVYLFELFVCATFACRNHIFKISVLLIVLDLLMMLKMLAQDKQTGILLEVLKKTQFM